MANSALAIDAVTGDLVRDGAKFSRASGVDYQKQQIRSVLQFFLGEWFLDVDGVGVPWFQRILGKKESELPAIKDIFRAQIQALSFVASVPQLELEIDSARTMTVTIGILNTDAVLVADTFEVSP